MSELASALRGRNDFRRGLVGTVSVAALLSVVAITRAEAAGTDGSQPSFWIELGGQFAQQIDRQDPFLPPFLTTLPRPAFDVVPPGFVDRPPPSSWDGNAKITFEPANTDWVLSAGILYGNSGRGRSLFQKTTEPSRSGGGSFASQVLTTKNKENHMILDFRAGKDFGLGMFGHGGNSVVSLGVRYAHFEAQQNSLITSQPTNVNAYQIYNRFYANLAETRKFTGVGPSLSWDASAGLLGDPARSEIALDWGASAAVLFGRQTIQGHQQTTKAVFNYFHRQFAYQSSASPHRKKEVVVPNIGGFAALSWRYPGAKVSIGYRADMFFGAMDGGVDVAHRENRGFYGPFASVSVGLGG